MPLVSQAIKAKGKMSIGEKEVRSREERVTTFFKLAFHVVKCNLTQLTAKSAGISQHSVKRLKCGQSCLDHFHD